MNIKEDLLFYSVYAAIMMSSVKKWQDIFLLRENRLCNRWLCNKLTQLVFLLNAIYRGILKEFNKKVYSVLEFL